MNYLAHAYLSFSHPGILTGNMISDYVKGRKQFDYPRDIQKGIQLHRAIDQFTDQHPVNREAKELFRPYYRLYSSAFIDVVYDHFLALDPEIFGEKSDLGIFADSVYKDLEKNKPHFPVTFERLFPYMKEQNWLFHYQFPEGIASSFGGLVRRAAYLTESQSAIQVFTEHYEMLKKCYTTFFPELLSFSEAEYEKLISDI